MDEILSGSILILTDKRLYQKGCLQEKYRFGMTNKHEGLQIISTKAIISLSLIEIKDYRKRFDSIILFGAGIFLFIQHHISTALLCLLFILPSIILHLFYHIKKKKLFVVNFMDGSLTTNLKWYPDDELKEFQAELEKILRS